MGYRWNINDAKNALKKTLDWRASFKPQNITLQEIEPIAKQGYMYQQGFDLHGRPVCYVKLGLDKSENNEANRLLKVCIFLSKPV